MNDTAPRKPRRMARGADGAAVAAPRSPTKLDTLEAMLLAGDGASIAEIVAVTGWQQHSVRGAMAGALKMRGLVITSARTDGPRRYRAVKPA